MEALLLLSLQVAWDKRIRMGVGGVFSHTDKLDLF